MPYPVATECRSVAWLLGFIGTRYERSSSERPRGAVRGGGLGGGEGLATGRTWDHDGTPV